MIQAHCLALERQFMGNSCVNQLTVSGLNENDLLLICNAFEADKFPGALVEDKEKWGTHWCKLEGFGTRDASRGLLEVSFVSLHDPLGAECLKDLTRQMPGVRFELRFYSDESEYYGATFAASERAASFSSRPTSLDPDILRLQMSTVTQYVDIVNKHAEQWYKENRELEGVLDEEEMCYRRVSDWIGAREAVLRPYMDSMLAIASQKVAAEAYEAGFKEIEEKVVEPTDKINFTEFFKKRLGESD